MDAHHWNRDHFVEDFVSVYEKALQFYEALARQLGVQIHSQKQLRAFLEAVRSLDNPNKLCLQKYAEYSLSASERASLRETATEHSQERVQSGSAKGFFEIHNYLGCVYYLKVDEVLFESDDRIVIQESKNSTRHSLPSLSDIKDGLFKLLLYSQLEELRWNSQPLEFSACLRITGKFRGTLFLPADTQAIDRFAENLSKRDVQKLCWLSEELKRLGIAGILEGHDD